MKKIIVYSIFCIANLLVIFSFLYAYKALNKKEISNDSKIIIYWSDISWPFEPKNGHMSVYLKFSGDYLKSLDGKEKFKWVGYTQGNNYILLETTEGIMIYLLSDMKYWEEDGQNLFSDWDVESYQVGQIILTKKGFTKTKIIKLPD